MDSLLQLISSHFGLIVKLLLSYWAFSALIDTIPMPLEGGSRVYKYAFSFGHALAGNLKNALAALKVPGAN